MSDIDSSAIGTSAGKILGLGLTIGAGTAMLRGMVDWSKPPRKRKPKKHKTPRKYRRPRKPKGLFPMISLKPMGNPFY